MAKATKTTTEVVIKERENLALFLLDCPHILEVWIDQKGEYHLHKVPRSTRFTREEILEVTDK